MEKGVIHPLVSTHVYVLAEKLLEMTPMSCESITLLVSRPPAAGKDGLGRNEVNRRASTLE